MQIFPPFASLCALSLLLTFIDRFLAGFIRLVISVVNRIDTFDVWRSLDQNRAITSTEMT